jgi:hypothetical protein
VIQRKLPDKAIVAESRLPSPHYLSESASEGLFFDLPSQTLDAAEMARARVYLEELGIRAQEYAVFDAPGGKPASRQCSFQKPFGRDIGPAAEMASEVFRRVYQFPVDFELVITEN